MSDLVERLRKYERGEEALTFADCKEAADTIESLQAKLEVARDMVSLALTKLDQPRSFPYVDDTKKVLVEALALLSDNVEEK